MELKSRFGIRGHLHLELYDEQGNLKEVRDGDNTVTEIADAHVADQMSDQGNAAIGYMAVGTGNGQTSADVGLDASLDRNALDSTTQGSGGDDNDVVYVCTWSPADGTGAITEAGIFIDDNNASMCFYDDFPVVNKGASDTLVITWTVTYGDS